MSNGVKDEIRRKKEKKQRQGLAEEKFNLNILQVFN